MTTASSESPDRLLGRPAARELVPTTPGASARWHIHDYPGPYCRWNYHPELEVHLIQHSTGRFIVGDRIGRFGPGQLVLVGSNLPHHWISDLRDGARIVNRDVVFQFHPQWLHDCESLLPELKEVAPLLVRSARGIEFTGATATAAALELIRIGESGGIRRLQHILEMLRLMSEAPEEEYDLLANPWVPPPHDPTAADLVDDVLHYVFSNIDSEVRMGEVAQRFRMSESAFSRFFSRAAGQSFSDTVRKFRLAQACQLLEHTTDPISSICRRSGYQNLSNFNRQFRREYGVSPTEYRRDFSAGHGR